MGWAPTSPPACAASPTPGTVAVSEPIERVVRDTFELVANAATDGQGRGRSDRHLPRRRRTRHRHDRCADRSSAVSANSRYLATKLGAGHGGHADVAGGRIPGRGRNRQDPAGLCRRRHGPAGRRRGARPVRVTVPHRRRAPPRTATAGTPVRHQTRLRSGGAPPQAAKRRSTQRALDPARVVPLLAPVLGIGPESGYEPAGRRSKAVRADRRGYPRLPVGVPGIRTSTGPRRRRALVRRGHRRGGPGAAS